MTIARVETSVVPVEVRHDVLSQAEYESLKSGLPQRHHLLLCKFLRATGVRLAEALRVTPNDLFEDGPHRGVLVKRGKQRGNERRKWDRVFLPPELATEIWDWVRAHKLAPNDGVFPRGPRAVQRAFERAGRDTIGRPVHPHELRGLYIKTLIDGGLSVEVAAKMVGHADPRTTLRHYYDLTSEQRAAIQRRIQV